MNLYIENKSFAFFKKACHTVEKNTERDICKLYIVTFNGAFPARENRYARKKLGVYDMEYIIYGEKHLDRAVKFLNRKKNPISLTLVLNAPLSEKAKKVMLKAKKEIKIIDNTPGFDNAEFCRTFKKILYKTGTEDTILDADIMHIYKFYETAFQCKFSSCLGNTVYVSKNGDVHFCPSHLNESIIGNIDGNEKYFESPVFRSVLHSAIEKRDACKKDCKYFDHCLGGCPMESGCSDFPTLFEKNKAALDKIIDKNETLSDKNLVTAKIVIKDIVYGDE